MWVVVTRELETNRRRLVSAISTMDLCTWSYLLDQHRFYLDLFMNHLKYICCLYECIWAVGRALRYMWYGILYIWGNLIKAKLNTWDRFHMTVHNTSLKSFWVGKRGHWSSWKQICNGVSANGLRSPFAFTKMRKALWIKAFMDFKLIVENSLEMNADESVAKGQVTKKQVGKTEQ